MAIDVVPSMRSIRNSTCVSGGIPRSSSGNTSGKIACYWNTLYAYFFLGLFHNVSEENVVLLVQALRCLGGRDRKRIGVKFITMYGGYPNMPVITSNLLILTVIKSI